MKKEPQPDSFNLTYLSEHKNTLIVNLKRKIRFAEEADNPELMLRYLRLSCADPGAVIDKRRECLLIQFQLLMDTLADDCLPVHWRCLCLDHINRPLFTLQNLADCPDSRQHVRLLFRQLKISSSRLQSDLFA